MASQPCLEHNVDARSDQRPPNHVRCRRRVISSRKRNPTREFVPQSTQRDGRDIKLQGTPLISCPGLVGSCTASITTQREHRDSQSSSSTFLSYRPRQLEDQTLKVQGRSTYNQQCLYARQHANVLVCGRSKHRVVSLNGKRRWHSHSGLCLG